MRISIILVILLIAKSAFCANGFGLEGMGGLDDGASRQPAATPRGSEAREERLRAEKEQATAVFSKLDADLDELLKAVAACEKVSDDKISEMERDFIATKRAYRYLDKEQQSDMMLAEAWMTYFKTDEIEAALKRSERACMLNPLSGDAYASSVVLAVLAGEQPKPKEMILRLAKREKDAVADPKMGSSVLDVDIPDIAMSLIGQKVPFPGMDNSPAATAPKAEDASTTQNDNGVYGCVMLWTLDPEPVNNEDIEKLKAVREQLPADKRAMLDQLLAAPPVTADDVKSQVGAFTALYENNTAKSRFMFLSINIDDPAKLQAFIAENKPQPMPIPGQSLPVLTSEMKKAMKMLGCLTLITDSTGTIRYAGSPKGFLPVMLINTFVPGSQKLGESQKITAPAAVPQGEMMPMDMGMGMGMGDMPMQPQIPVNNEVKDSNSLPAQQGGSESGVEGQAKPAELTDEQRQANTDKLLPEKQTEAENLLTAARMFRGSHTRLGSSKKVVEDCMAVIEKFPGTTYEKEAREILDSVPEHQKKKYGIE